MQMNIEKLNGKISENISKTLQNSTIFWNDGEHGFTPPIKSDKL